MLKINRINWTEKYKPKNISELTINNESVNKVHEWLMKFEVNRVKVIKENNEIACKIKSSNSDKSSSKKRRTVTKKKIKILDEDVLVEDLSDIEINSDDEKFDKTYHPYTNKKLKEPDMIKSSLILSGNHGVGKSVSVQVILKENKYEIIKLDTDLLKDERFVNKLLYYSKKKRALLVDELETITTKKENLLFLTKENEINWYFPIIFISNNQHSKLLVQLRKTSFEVKYFTPSQSEIFNLTFNLIKKEKIKILEERIINELIRHSQYDIRRIILILQDIKLTYGNNKINQDVLDEYMRTSKEKDVKLDLYKSTENILNGHYNINECARAFDTEKVLLPLMVQQNYLSSIVNKTTLSRKNIYKNKLCVDKIIKVSGLISFSDSTENHIYSNQSWDLQQIHGILSCSLPSHYISHGLSLKNKNLKQKIEFATDLNKTSIQRINKKKILKATENFKSMEVIDYIFMIQVINKLLEKNEIKECYLIMKSYGYSISQLESLIKIDKISSGKTKVMTKHKKEFQKLSEIL